MQVKGLNLQAHLSFSVSVFPCYICLQVGFYVKSLNLARKLYTRSFSFNFVCVTFNHLSKFAHYAFLRSLIINVTLHFKFYYTYVLH